MAQISILLSRNSTVRTVIRFSLVGALGTLVDLTLFSMLHLVVGTPVLLANSLSYSAGIVNNFILHRKWTFSQRPRKSTARQLAQFAGASLSGLALNNSVILLITPVTNTIFADPGLSGLIAKLCAFSASMVWNFLASYLWTFRK